MTTAFDAASSGQNYDRIIPGNSFGAMVNHSAITDSRDAAAGGDDDLSAPQKMFSALTGSLITSMLVTPLDVVRVRWQSQPVRQGATVDFSRLATRNSTLNITGLPPANLGVTSCCREVFFMNNTAEACLAMPTRAVAGSALTAAECAVEETERKTFSSTLDGLRKISRSEGVAGLWRGLSPTLAMVIPANIIYMTGYDWLRFNSKSPIARRFGDDTAPLIAGSTARVLAATAVNPIELFRTRMQASTGASTTGHLVNTFKDVQEMVGTHGYRSLWRGITLTLWRDVPFSGIYWWGYETIRGQLTDLRERARGVGSDTAPAGDPSSVISRTMTRRQSQSRENHADTFLDSFIAGATSGAMASIVTMPFDVGKTRTQVFRDTKQGAGAAAAAKPEQGSMTQLLKHIFRTEGIQGLWKGWIPRTLKVAPACAIMISSYEIGKRMFRSMNDKRRAEEEAAAAAASGRTA